MTYKNSMHTNIQAKITVDRNDWHIIDRQETVSNVNEPLFQGLNNYSKAVAGFMLPIYRDIGQDNLIAAHKKDPKNGIRNLIHQYMSQKRRERESNE